MNLYGIRVVNSTNITLRRIQVATINATSGPNGNNGAAPDPLAATCINLGGTGGSPSQVATIGQGPNGGGPGGPGQNCNSSTCPSEILPTISCNNTSNNYTTAQRGGTGSPGDNGADGLPGNATLTHRFNFFYFGTFGAAGAAGGNGTGGGGGGAGGTIEDFGSEGGMGGQGGCGSIGGDPGRAAVRADPLLECTFGSAKTVSSLTCMTLLYKIPILP
eukprot:TRINITY_DN5283_c0_g1_i1.p1 TRINITY_DN5283_c0_g1~~TRINITY_DN5283_c0_g1_i1.p1  ORF type:complete len:218 (+),score=44.69 TRINITY_DN5283_c0_g1_i1:517-1170(+)